jgi:dipeptidyl aminopeptidase/acylaminoacyl peptidase
MPPGWPSAARCFASPRTSVENPPQLLDVAAAVADLTPIDWAALEAEAADSVGRAALNRLRLLDQIVRACAAIVPPGESAAAPDTPPTAWGPFTIHERLGGGTFGDVYRAHDRRLDRIVALKVLKPGREGADPVESEVVREGQLLAKIRHSNVVTVYGAERIDARVGLWMEFVDGRTLEEELRASGPLPAAAVIEVGLALCGALAAVHDAGLLHRDLKAQNVMRAADGRLLLTDFGAGRARVDADGGGGPGDLAGTPLYIAPEVLAGTPASVASEIYSVGVLLYHLATGSFPVRGRTLRELREAHARGEHVRMRAYRGKVPKALAAVIERAIQSDPAARFKSVQALAAAIQRARPRRWRLLAASLALLVLAFFVVVGLNVAWSMAPPLRIVDRSVVLEDADGIEVRFARGDRLYYARGDLLFSLVPGRAGSERPEFDASSAFTVVDLNATATDYLALLEETSELYALPTSGQPIEIGKARCRTGAAWSPDGRRVACADEKRLDVLSADGRSALTLPSPPAIRMISGLEWSPQGDRIRFAVDNANRDRRADEMWEIRADGKGLRQVLSGFRIVPHETGGRWVLGGRFFVFQSVADWRTDLWVLGERRAVFDWSGAEPVALTQGPESFGGGQAVSPDGGTLYATGYLRRGELVRYDRSTGRFVPYLGGPSAVSLTYSPDRRSVAYISFPEMKLWRADADGRNALPLVHAPVEMKGAAWSPDNRWIAFASRLESEHVKIFLLPADGSGAPRAISREDKEQGNPSWKPDGRQLCYGDVPTHYGIPDGGEALHIYDLETGRVSDVPGSEGLWTCRWSPDGRYIAGVRIGLDSRQMMINLFDTKLGTWRGLTNAHHVNEPTWSRDSQFIYYDTEGQSPATLRRVRITGGAVEEVASFEHYPRATQWSGLTPYDEPLVLHEAGSAKLYALKLGTR